MADIWQNVTKSSKKVAKYNFQNNVTFWNFFYYKYEKPTRIQYFWHNFLLNWQNFPQKCQNILGATGRKSCALTQVEREEVKDDLISREKHFMEHGPQALVDYNKQGADPLPPSSRPVKSFDQVIYPPPPPHWDWRVKQPNHINLGSSSALVPMWTPS